MSDGPLRPEDLRKIAEEAEMAKLREAMAREADRGPETSCGRPS